MELAAHRILFGEENQQNPKNPWVYPTCVLVHVVLMFDV